MPLTINIDINKGAYMYDTEEQETTFIEKEKVQVLWWEADVDEDKLNSVKKKLEEVGLKVVLISGVRMPHVIDLEKESTNANT